MIKSYSNQLVRNLYITIGVLLLSSAANASTITIISDEAVELDIAIEGGAGTVLPSKKEIKDTIKPGGEKIYEITKATFGTETFTITGKVKIPSIHNKCQLLSIDKDYKIVFTGSKTGGTICKAEPISQ